MRLRQGIILLVGLAVVSGYDSKSEECYTPNSYPGQCVPLQQCSAMVKFIAMRESSGITTFEQQFLDLSKCHSTEGQQSNVCCNEEDPFLKTEATSPPPIIDPLHPENNSHNLLPNPAKLQCGRTILSDRIYDGKNTEIGEFPWLSLLRYEKMTSEADNVCGGSLINNRYVLTAAHCVTGKAIISKGQLLYVRLGEHNLNTTEDCKVVGDVRQCADPVQDITVESIIAHPEYVPSDRNQHNDIALVRLSQTVTYSQYILPICLPPVQYRTETGENVTIAGWGRTLNARRSLIKQQLAIPVTDQQQCKTKYGSLRRSTQVLDTQLCAGGKFKQDACEGDSGGPLMTLIGPLWYAEGLVSFGHACGFDGWPGIYTRVSEYIPWIHSVLEP